MSLRRVIVKCPTCGKDNPRWVSVKSPEEYTDSDNATLLSQFWCCSCEAPIAIRYKIIKLNTEELLVTVKHYVEPSSVFSQPKPEHHSITRPKAQKRKR
jgi:hypothetical protein